MQLLGLTVVFALSGVVAGGRRVRGHLVPPDLPAHRRVQRPLGTRRHPVSDRYIFPRSAAFLPARRPVQSGLDACLPDGHKRGVCWLVACAARSRARSSSRRSRSTRVWVPTSEQPQPVEGASLETASSWRSDPVQERPTGSGGGKRKGVHDHVEKKRREGGGWHRGEADDVHVVLGSLTRGGRVVAMQAITKTGLPIIKRYYVGRVLRWMGRGTIGATAVHGRTGRDRESACEHLHLGGRGAQWCASRVGKDLRAWVSKRGGRWWESHL